MDAYARAVPTVWVDSKTVLCLHVVAWKEAVFIPVENMLNAQCFLLVLLYSVSSAIFSQVFII